MNIPKCLLLLMLHQFLSAPVEAQPGNLITYGYYDGYLITEIQVVPSTESTPLSWDGHKYGHVRSTVNIQKVHDYFLNHSRCKVPSTFTPKIELRGEYWNIANDTGAIQDRLSKMTDYGGGVYAAMGYGDFHTSQQTQITITNSSNAMWVLAFRNQNQIICPSLGDLPSGLVAPSGVTYYEQWSQGQKIKNWESKSRVNGLYSGKKGISIGVFEGVTLTALDNEEYIFRFESSTYNPTSVRFQIHTGTPGSLKFHNMAGKEINEDTPYDITPSVELIKVRPGNTIKAGDKIIVPVRLDVTFL